MKRLIAKRKEYRLFGRGTIEFINGDNPRVLAFVREYDGESLLVIANLSRFVQCTRLNLDKYNGTLPTEVFGRSRFPEVAETPYFVSLGPHEFYWLGLEKPQADVSLERPALTVRGAWTNLFEHGPRHALTRTLMQYVAERRWYRGKARTRKHASILDILRFDSDDRFAIVLLNVEYEHGRAETYVVPIAFSEEGDPAESLRTPALVIAHLTVTDVPSRGAITGILYDALCSDVFNAALMRSMRTGTGATGRHGSLTGSAFAALRAVPAETPMIPRLTSAEQSNTGVLYGDKFMLKLLRAIEEGPNLEYEVGKFLADHDFRGSPRLGGVLEYRVSGREPSTVGTLHEFVPNQGDAWSLTLDALDRYFDAVLSDPRRPDEPPIGHGSVVQRARLAPADRVLDWVGTYIDRIRLLGMRTAELHVALASEPADAIFAPEPYDIMHQQSMYGSVSAQVSRTCDLLRNRLARLSPDSRTLAETILSREGEIDRLLEHITRRRIDVIRTRTHGDYHLGQVLWTGDDFKIIDFEGEPARPLSQRRYKRNPLRDVAGMLRSLQYATFAALRDGRHRAEDMPVLQVWARAWAQWTSASFLGGYLDRAANTRILPPSDAELEMLIHFFLVEKVIYEIDYELNNRPDWVDIPLRGLINLLP
jgi:maltose alpha-D-glucosyltransferase/alpha-amylase